jgi:hemerythrin-like domain-containing protein
MMAVVSRPGFEDPIEILNACHEKVRHFASLTIRLRDYLQKVGVDASATEAATRIRRYFNVAAVLHHQDEELDLFPALMTLKESLISPSLKVSLLNSIQSLQREHETLGEAWGQIDRWLASIEQMQPVPEPACLDLFARAYTRHADREENEIYPFAKYLDKQDTERIGLNMVKRRQA